ncbi:hypothetical protein M0802_016715 [Mischocyttarus mexicanus]|nr:hypothetical protein M0802_016715 [Mischocyttarus mexicanus]
MEVEERIPLVENMRKRKTMSDEEGQIDQSKKTARKGISQPAKSEVTIEKKIRQFKIFESKVKLIEMEDIEQKDLTDIKKNVSEMLVLIQQLSEKNKKKESSESAPEQIESRLNKFEEAIKSVCDSIKELKDKPTKAISYADKLKAPAVQKVIENNGNRCRHVVAIYPMEKKTAVNSDETEAEDLDRVIKSEKLHAAGLKVEVPSKKKPLLIVYGVPKETTDKEFLSGLKKQNSKESKTTEFFDTIRISHRTGDRSMEKVNVVIEVSPLVRESLLKNERVYIGWESLRIKDYTTVSRCYKCQAFGPSASLSKVFIRDAQINAQNSKSVVDELRLLAYEHQIDILSIQEPYAHNNSVVSLGINAKDKRSYFALIRTLSYSTGLASRMMPREKRLKICCRSFSFML